jgi:hypothetical protein
MMKVLKYIAIAGNALFILWATHNGIDEGFKGAPAEIVSYICLMAVLALNIVLLSRRRKP